MGGTLRLLRQEHEPALRELLAEDLVERVFIASRLEAHGLESLRCFIWGWFIDGELRSVCHQGANVMMVNPDDEAVEAFARTLTRSPRSCAALVGASEPTLALFRILSDADPSWDNPRTLRPSQPMLALSGDPGIEGDPRVRPIGMGDFARYFEASVAMYTEEVGVSPVAVAAQGYLEHVRTLISTGRSFGIVEDGRVLFKADLGATAGHVAQVQGVWVDPELRGQGLAAPAMAQVVRLARERFDTISLYVNDFNLPARAVYSRCGFEQVGEFATVLY